MKNPIFPFILLIFFFYACDTSDNSTDVFADPKVNPEAVAEGPTEGDTVLSLVLGLDRSQELLAERVDDIHDPTSPFYHDFRSITEVANEFGADEAVIQSVQQYLSDRGIVLEADVTGGFLFGEVTVSQLNQLFSTELYNYKIDKEEFIAPLTDPKLPSALRGLVTEVLGLSTEPSLWTDRVSRPLEDQSISTNTIIDMSGSPTVTGTREGCEEVLKSDKTGFTPNQFRTAYGIDTLHQQGYEGQGIAMALVEGASFDQKNIDMFTSCFGISDPVVPTVVQIGDDKLEPGGEPFLDIEVIMMVAPKLSGLYVFQIGLRSLADWIVLYASPYNSENTGGVPVHIVSQSYANCEIHWGGKAINFMEYIFMSAAAAGIHVFAAAGDSGSSSCFHHDHVTKTISAEFPPSSQYVTGVGGTNLALNDDNTIKGQGVWNDTLPPYPGQLAAGSGGKSRFIKRPSWQRGTNISSGKRTTPDVAFYADVYPGFTFNDSTHPAGWKRVGGTSGAAPFFAASMALVLQVAQENDVTLDLTNRMIYKLANSDAYDEVFQDVVIGNNDLFNVGCCEARPGYDMASGWGSLNITSLVEVLVPQ